MTVIATAGHVDHGKSALITAICGTDPDRLAEEKRRGMTIELGFAHRVAPDGTVLSFVDVPGHSDFVHTMVAGASGVGVVLLVVDAGEGWKPQTEEHLGIIGVLGVRSGVVALSRCDRVDAGTVVTRTREIMERLRTAREEGVNVGWNGIVTTSAVSGEGIDALVDSLASAVRSTNTEVDALGRPRLFCDRVFTMAGAGTVVTGTLEGASVGRGDTFVVHRTGDEVRVRDLRTHGDQVEKGLPGTRCAMNLTGAGTDDLRRGDVLVRRDEWWDTTVMDCRVDVLTGSMPLRRRAGYTLHLGTAEQLVSVRPHDGDISAGAAGNVRVRLAHALPVTPGDRFVLRDPGTGTTLGGGTVLDVDPHARLSRASPAPTVEAQLAGRGWIDVADARRLTGAALEPVTGSWYATADVVERTLASLRSRVSAGSFDVAELEPHERLLLASHVGATADHGTVGGADSLHNHPVSLEVLAQGLTPSPRTERDIVRRLVQRSVLFEHDNIAFHRDVLDGLHGTLLELWAVHPGGFTVSHLRTALGISRKHAVPLAECLDRRGWTRRAGDLRLPGPLARAGE
ncbi:MAG: selenocysteine-specific elongation factor [Actinomycetota bacterium]|jgi:selenocysteine-specific elongation factor